MRFKKLGNCLAAFHMHCMEIKGPRSPEHPLCLRVNHIDVTTHKLEISKMYLEQWKRLGLRHFI